MNAYQILQAAFFALCRQEFGGCYTEAEMCFNLADEEAKEWLLDIVNGRQRLSIDLQGIDRDGMLHPCLRS